MSNASLWNRSLRAARLDVAVYEEVEAQPDAMGQATLVVILSALAAGIGSSGFGFGGILIMTISALFSWYVWAYITYFVGTRFMAEKNTEADPGQLLRTLGFAAAPGMLRVLGIIPGLQAISFIVAGLWMLATTVVAVRQALDYTSTGRAVFVCVIGWIVHAMVITATRMIL